jgi:isopenicillin-N N-acyltransferase-like protein
MRSGATESPEHPTGARGRVAAARSIRRLLLAGRPGEMGEAHGARFRDEIRRYADERVHLAGNGSWAGHAATREDVLGLADAMLPAHRAFAPDLYEEMEAMARASGISPAEAVVVGGFTDFVDAVRAQGGSPAQEDDCTAALVPGNAADGGAFLAQTWDMHDSATEHVVMLELRPQTGPRALVFSTVGCLGQIGMNDAGICVGINNLHAAAGRIGVTWPFVVRKVLQQTDLEAALQCLRGVDLTGAHNYLLLDRHGRGYNVEAMPGGRSVEALEEAPLVHANHCLDDEMRRQEAARPPDLLDSSHRRLERAREILATGPVTLELLMELTRDPLAICQRSTPPHHIESSGAVIVSPTAPELWAVWGIPADNPYEHFRFDDG